MANDSRFVLDQLVRSGLWSQLGNPFEHKHFILDADSAVTFLYKQCAANHLRRHRASRLARPTRRTADYYAATIVNYCEFGQYARQLLDFFSGRSIELHIVYRGKLMEAPLFGLLPAQMKKNTQRAAESLSMLLQCDNLGGASRSPTSRSRSGSTSRPSSSSSSTTSTTSTSTSSKSVKLPAAGHSLELYMRQLRPSRPNLALNIFKQIVNEHQRRASKRPLIRTHQAYYSAFPTLAKLARDFKCPVLTNEGDFIIMDVRAGFVLFEHFFSTFLEAQNALARYSSSGSVASNTSATSTKSAAAAAAAAAAKSQSRGARSNRASRPPPAPCKSPAIALGDAKSLFQQTSCSTSRLRFNRNALFLRQHPGLNQTLVLQLFPLTAGEFLLVHAKSMTKMRIYDREFKEQDLICAARGDLLDARASVKKYHLAAGRLEMVSRYLCTKDPELLNSLLRGEAHRLLASGSTFDEDYKQLFNYYAVAFDFKGRLKSVLRHLTEPSQLSYVANCLLERECSADYLLSLLCCAVGKLSALSYNKTMQFEDLLARHSAFAMLDRGKQLLMSLLSGNRTHRSELASSLSKQERAHLATRFQMASLTVLDRQGQQLVERSLPTSGGTSGRRPATELTLAALAKRANNNNNNNNNKEEGHSREAAAFMELAFEQQAGTFIKLVPPRIVQLIQGHGNADPNGQRESLGKQLAVLLNLHRYSLGQAAREDPYFKLHYLRLSAPFELALATQLMHTGHLNGDKRLLDLISKLDLENVAQLAFEQERPAASRRSKSGGGGAAHSLVSAKHTAAKSCARSLRAESRLEASDSSASSVRRQVRHLIELLNSSLEAYCELNAFLNYPLPSLDLARCYNPILLFNLTLHNLAQQGE